ncbi:MAG: aspartate-semialdehyde dehydrogenase [Pseudobdellovibrionaceae bacterium]
MTKQVLMQKLKIGVVGATGMVGQTFMNILEERKFPVAELRLFASEASLGKKISFMNRQIPLQVLKPQCFQGLDLVFFSSGDDISEEWAPKAVEDGAFAVDNSAAFRMNPKIHLVVPEVNGHLLKRGMAPQIIANPNCSTIQLVVALKPLHEHFKVKEVKAATYQAVSGAGLAGAEELENQIAAGKGPLPTPKTFPHAIAYNLIPQIGSFNDLGFCSEEWKIINETKKILEAPEMHVSAFTVRVPILNAHSEAVWITFDRIVTRDEFMTALRSGEGIVVEDDPKNSVYPTPRAKSGEDPVYVGRIHRDPTQQNLWQMWVVSDNLRKGAALNGVQIAERLFL